MATKPTVYNFYVYKVTHKTGKFYIGSRKTSVAPEEDLWVKYYTSGSLVKQLLAAGSAADFVPQVLATFETHDQCYWAEQALIKEHIKIPSCLNFYYHDVETTQKKFSTYDKKDTPEQRQLKSKIHKGLPKPHTALQNQRIGDAQRGVPRAPHTEEWKRNMAKILLGRTAWVVSPTAGPKKVFTSQLENYLSAGFQRGRKVRGQV